ncbi:hypothetical protein [Fulvivirga lutimaris]|uniref:hypothetical protein n=1 Tax=Fulvivirga lutimaris TaxID=1819566 RepID=UPI0012BCF91E|nr:hypothetical protein [Fulvivirga lutimaris]MTI41257.1 hypothetical protein [Fulvivirga lutimaris]
MLKKKLFLTLLFSAGTVASSFAQCAMCRATVENNLSNGDVGIGAGLNFGILYLLVVPYLAIATIGFLWYRNSRQNAAKYEQVKSGH